MMTSTYEMEMHDFSLAAASTALRQGRLSAVSLTQHMLDRISRWDSTLHAYSEVLAEEALGAARAADAERARGFIRGPLHGVPIGVKDLIDIEGSVTVAGTLVKRTDQPAKTDATVVRRLRKAGAVLLGKHQLSESATLFHHPEVIAPRNPWGFDYWTGASSSGSGVAVAAGLAFGTLGTDTGGSIRFPAAANGISGLKPTWGRISRNGIFPYCEPFDHVGPMARTVEDCALLLQAIAGADDDDDTSSLRPVPDYQAALRSSIAGLRIGVDRRAVESCCNAAVAASFEAACNTFTAQGARLVPITLPYDGAAVMLAMTLTLPAALANHQSHYPARAADFGPGLRAHFRFAQNVDSIVLTNAHKSCGIVRGTYNRLLSIVDLIITPALQRSLPTNLELDKYYPDSSGFAQEFARFITPVSVSGHPALCFPAGFDERGMPVGIQLIGRAFDEATLLQAGHAYQSVTDWHTRRPPPRTSN